MHAWRQQGLAAKYTDEQELGESVLMSREMQGSRLCTDRDDDGDALAGRDEAAHDDAGLLRHKDRRDVHVRVPRWLRHDDQRLRDGTAGVIVVPLPDATACAHVRTCAKANVADFAN